MDLTYSKQNRLTGLIKRDSQLRALTSRKRNHQNGNSNVHWFGDEFPTQ